MALTGCICGGFRCCPDKTQVVVCSVLMSTNGRTQRSILDLEERADFNFNMMRFGRLMFLFFSIMKRIGPFSYQNIQPISARNRTESGSRQSMTFCGHLDNVFSMAFSLWTQTMVVRLVVNYVNLSNSTKRSFPSKTRLKMSLKRT